MPYLAHFGLREHPFTLTPNTQQYFPTAANTQILQSLEYGVRRNSGIMKVVGEVGTGKTLLCRLLLRQFRDETEVAYLSAPQAEDDALIAMVCHEFGLKDRPKASRARMLQELNDFLLHRHENGRDCVLVVDEAQALGAAGLETVRLLSNLETETAKLLQIVLFGQTELDALLARSDLRQLNQRIAFSFATAPLSPAEGVSYINHRLRLARQDGVAWTVIDPKAVDLIVRASGGVPRVINILCDKALLIAYGDGHREVSQDHVRAAVQDSPTIIHATKDWAKDWAKDWGKDRNKDRGGRFVATVAGIGGVIVGAGLAAAVALGGPGTWVPWPSTAPKTAPEVTPVAPLPSVAPPTPTPSAPAPAVSNPGTETTVEREKKEAPRRLTVPTPAAKTPTARPVPDAPDLPKAVAADIPPQTTPDTAPKATPKAVESPDTTEDTAPLPTLPAPTPRTPTPQVPVAPVKPAPTEPTTTEPVDALPAPRTTVEIRSAIIRRLPAPLLTAPPAKPAITTPASTPETEAGAPRTITPQATSDEATRDETTEDETTRGEATGSTPTLPQARRGDNGQWIWE